MAPVALPLSVDLAVERVLAATAAVLGVRPRDIYGPCRKEHVAFARKVALWLLSSHPLLTRSEIGRRFKRDQSTVTWSVRKVEAMVAKSDIVLEATVNRIRQHMEIHYAY
jgi:chromosomal replication initiation ATPase DnaA